MKKAFLIVFCALFFIPSFFVSGFASVHMQFPRPYADDHNLYLIGSERLFQIHLNNESISFSISFTGQTGGVSYGYDSVICSVSVAPSGSQYLVTLTFYNYSATPVRVYVINYRPDGSNPYVYDSIQIPAVTFASGTITAGKFNSVLRFNDISDGFWFSEGFVFDNSTSFNLLDVTFNETVDYSPSFLAINSLLSSLNSAFGSQSDLILQKLDAILASDAAALQWFIDVFYDEAQGYWTFAKINFNGIINYLDSISKALGAGEDETATIADDMSGYNEMESARSSLQVTDVQGRPVDAAAQVEDAFSEAASGIGSLGSSVGSINSLMTDIISVHPLIIVPIIVVLALGLIVTILGKNKSE